MQPPPAWRQLCSWQGPIPAWPDAGHPNPWWWHVGLHGGAGVSALTAALPSAGDARRQLPTGETHQSPYCVLIARTHREGLDHAHDLARQIATGLIPPRTAVLGLVLVADGDRGLARPLRRFARLVAAAYPRCWHVPWIPEWRSTRPDPSTPLPPSVECLGRDLAQLTGLSTQH